VRDSKADGRSSDAATRADLASLRGSDYRRRMPSATQGLSTLGASVAPARRRRLGQRRL
jgi:hypothetical protein